MKKSTGKKQFIFILVIILFMSLVTAGYLHSTAMGMETGEDIDGDGVSDIYDECPNTMGDNTASSFGDTVLPKRHVYIPEIQKEYMITNAGTAKNIEVKTSYSMDRMRGCSCAQILEKKPGVDPSDTSYGCSGGVVEDWIYKRVPWSNPEMCSQVRQQGIEGEC